MDPRIPYRNTATQLTKVLDYGVQIFYFRILKSSQAIHLHALLWLSSLRTLPRGFVRPLSTQPSCFIYLVGRCTPNLVPVHPGKTYLVGLSVAAFAGERTTNQLANPWYSNGTCTLLHLREEMMTWRLCPGCLLTLHTFWNQKGRMCQEWEVPHRMRVSLGRSNKYRSIYGHLWNYQIQAI